MLNGGRRGRSGVLAIEVAVTMPFLVIVALGAFDLVNAVATWRRVRDASTAIAEIATSQAIQNGVSNGSSIQSVLSSGAAQDSSTALYAYAPILRSSGTTIPFSITLSTVVFATTAGCGAATTCVCVSTTTNANGTVNTPTSTIGGTTSTNPAANPFVQCYTANTAWSTQYGANNTQTDTPLLKRPCASTQQLTAVATGSSATLSTLPQGVWGPYSLLVADISYTFSPTFTKFITGPITFFETAYVPPRSGSAGQYVQYTPTTSADVCTGYL